MQTCPTCNKSFFTSHYHKCKSIKFLNNSICKVCLRFPESFFSLYEGKCSECAIFNRKSVIFSKSRSLIYPANRDSLPLSRESFEAFSFDMAAINTKLASSEQNLHTYKNHLKQIAGDIIKEKLAKLNEYENAIEDQLSEWRREIEKEINVINPDLQKRTGRILQRLINSSQLPVPNLIESLFFHKDLKKIIADCHSQSIKSVSELTIEPAIIHFSHLANGKLLKIYLFSKNPYPCSLSFPLSDSKEWNIGSSFIEIPNDLYFYSGCKNPLFLPKEDNTRIVNVKEFHVYGIKTKGDARENHSVEYYDSEIYAFGGCKDTFQKLNLYTQEWGNRQKFPENLETVHSIKVKNRAILAGSKAKDLYGYTFESNFFEKISNNFERDRNKLVFSYDETVVLFCGGVLYKSDGKCKKWIRARDRILMNNDRCAGKAKQLYSYLYFITEDEVLWRLCTITFEIEKFKLA